MSELTRERNRERGKDRDSRREASKRERERGRQREGTVGPFSGATEKKEDETDVQSLFHLVEKESERGQTLHASHIFLSFYIMTHHSFLL